MLEQAIINALVTMMITAAGNGEVINMNTEASPEVHRLMVEICNTDEAKNNPAVVKICSKGDR